MPSNTTNNTPVAIGIDLGTCFVSAAVYQQSKLQRIPNRFGNYLTPSFVAFTENYGRLVGEDAKEQVTINPENTIYDVISLIGQKWEDVAAKITSCADRFPFSLVNDQGHVRILVEQHNQKGIYRPEELLSTLLENLKLDAEKYLGKTVTDAVITVPAYYTYSQRLLVGEAATVAGFASQRIISEPEAAALAYAYKNRSVMGQDTNVMIVDLGGANINVSLSTIGNEIVEIHAIAGESNWGGQAMINRMLVHFAQEFQKTHKKDLNQDLRALARLRLACEKAMIKLSTCVTALVQIDQLFQGIDFCGSIDRVTFEQLVGDIVVHAKNPVQRCLKDAKMDKGNIEIDNVVVIGGCSHIPRVRKILQNLFEDQQVSFEDVGAMDRLTVDGAAVLAGITTGELSRDLGEFCLLGVTPFSLGFKTPLEDSMVITTTVIRRHTTIPTKQTYTVSMPVDDQAPNSVSVEIYEGERCDPENNRFLGKATLTGIPLKRSGDGKSQAKLEVTFDINHLNDLKVKVLHVETKKEVELDVTAELEGQRKEEVEIMKNNAKWFREKERRERERAVAKDGLGACCFTLECGLREEEDGEGDGDKGKVTEEVRKEILEECGNVRSWMEESGVEAEKEVFEQKLEKLKALCREKYASFLLEMDDSGEESGNEEEDVKGKSREQKSNGMKC